MNFTRSQSMMHEGLRRGVSAAQSNHDAQLKKKYGKSMPGVGGSTQMDALRKERDQFGTAEQALSTMSPQQKSAAGIDPYAQGDKAAGQLQQSAAKNAMDYSQRFAEAGMRDQIQDQFKAQEIADPYMREQDKRNIDRMNAASSYADRSRKKLGQDVTVNYRKPGSSSRV